MAKKEGKRPRIIMSRRYVRVYSKLNGKHNRDRELYAHLQASKNDDLKKKMVAEVQRQVKEMQTALGHPIALAK